MIRYGIAFALVLTAIFAVETLFPVSAACITAALVITNGKTSCTR